MNTNLPKTLLLSLLCLSLILVSSTLAQRKAVETEVKGHTMYTLMAPGGIPAIFDPEFVSIEEADKLYYDSEPVIVVTDGKTAKAYSTWYLDHHEIVNDYIGGNAITVTW